MQGNPLLSLFLTRTLCLKTLKGFDKVEFRSHCLQYANRKGIMGHSVGHKGQVFSFMSYKFMTGNCVALFVMKEDKTLIDSLINCLFYSISILVYNKVSLYNEM